MPGHSDFKKTRAPAFFPSRTNNLLLFYPYFSDKANTFFTQIIVNIWLDEKTKEAHLFHISWKKQKIIQKGAII